MNERGLLRCVKCSDLFEIEEVVEDSARHRAPQPVDCPTCGTTVAHFTSAGVWVSRSVD
jgi:NAD-dependent SIR2 family protein deacetylase